MDIAGGVFVVSGGASGLGAATVRRLAARGGKVVAVDINASMGESLVRELGDGNVQFHRADVASETELAEAVQRAESMGPLRGAVACAGIEHAERVVGKSGPHALDAFSRVLNVNVLGSFNLARLAAAAISRNEPNQGGERGVVVFTSSVAAFDGQIGQAAYSASKGAIASMTLPMARDLAKLGIRVAAIAPGVFDTPLMARFPDAVKQALESLVPFPPRLGRPEEFAALVEHIISNPMLNGEVIRLDGALRMPPK